MIEIERDKSNKCKWIVCCFQSSFPSVLGVPCTSWFPSTLPLERFQRRSLGNVSFEEIARFGRVEVVRLAGKQFGAHGLRGTRELEKPLFFFTRAS